MLVNILAKCELIFHVLLESSDISERPIFFGGSAGSIARSGKPFSLDPVLGICTCLSEELWCLSSKGNYAPFSAAILRETQENMFSLTLTLFVKRGMFFS